MYGMKRNVSAQDKAPDYTATIFYDEACPLCRASVRFIQRRDRHDRFRFVALQSSAGQQAARQGGLDPAGPGSLILEDAQGLHVRSTGKRVSPCILTLTSSGGVFSFPFHVEID